MCLILADTAENVSLFDGWYNDASLSSDCLRIGKPSRDVTDHPGQLSIPAG